MKQYELLQAPTMHHLQFIQIYPVIGCTLTLQVHHALSSPLGLNISLAVHFSLLGLQPSQGFSCICCQHRKNDLSLFSSSPPCPVIFAMRRKLRRHPCFSCWHVSRLNHFHSRINYIIYLYSFEPFYKGTRGSDLSRSTPPALDFHHVICHRDLRVCSHGASSLQFETLSRSRNLHQACQ